jgi:ankyrin repeat protein
MLTIDAYRIQFENSPMVAACEGGYINIVECLVEYDYNIDHSDINLPTPLFSACRYGNKDVVDFQQHVKEYIHQCHIDSHYYYTSVRC